MTQHDPLRVFISYSASDPVAGFFAGIAEAVLNEHGMQSVNYRRDKEPSFANVNATFSVGSLQQVDSCDAVLSLFIPHVYGARPADGSCDGADGARSLCWLEAERAWSTDKDVLSVVPIREWPRPGDLPEEQHQAVMDGRGHIMARQPDDIGMLNQFRRRLVEQGAVTEFGSVDNFREQLGRVLDTWRDQGVPVFELYYQCSEPLFGQSKILEGLANRLREPGGFGVHGSWGIGKSSLVAQAAAQLRDEKVFRRIVSVDCRDRSTEEIAVEICALSGQPLDLDVETRIASAMKRQFSGSRNLIILDHATSPELFEIIVGGQTTTVVVTDDADLLLTLGIPNENCLQVQPLESDAAVALLTSIVGSEKASAELAALRGLAADFGGSPSGTEKPSV